MADEKRLVLAFLKFLQDQKSAGRLDHSKAKSLAAAIASLEAAYGMSVGDQTETSHNAVDTNLLEMFKSHTSSQGQRDVTTKNDTRGDVTTKNDTANRSSTGKWLYISRGRGPVRSSREVTLPGANVKDKQPAENEQQEAAIVSLEAVYGVSVGDQTETSHNAVDTNLHTSSQGQRGDVMTKNDTRGDVTTKNDTRGDVTTKNDTANRSSTGKWLYISRGRGPVRSSREVTLPGANVKDKQPAENVQQEAVIVSLEAAYGVSVGDQTETSHNAVDTNLHTSSQGQRGDVTTKNDTRGDVTTKNDTANRSSTGKWLYISRGRGPVRSSREVTLPGANVKDKQPAENVQQEANSLKKAEQFADADVEDKHDAGHCEESETEAWQWHSYRWEHDLFHEEEQRPKTRNELLYGEFRPFDKPTRAHTDRRQGKTRQRPQRS